MTVAVTVAVTAAVTVSVTLTVMVAVVVDGSRGVVRALVHKYSSPLISRVLKKNTAIISRFYRKTLSECFGRLSALVLFRMLGGF